MRLIDADAFFKNIIESCGCIPYVKGRKGETIYMNNLIDEQPTAYDVDKVVERLEKEGNSIFSTHFPEDEQEFMNNGVAKGFWRSAEIVKSGGIE